MAYKCMGWRWFGEWQADFSKASSWPHVLNEPPTWLSSVYGYKLGFTFSEVLDVDTWSHSFWCWVRMDVTKSIKGTIKVALLDHSEQWFLVQYKWLRSIYFQCGYFNHVEKDCLFLAPLVLVPMVGAYVLHPNLHEGRLLLAWVTVTILLPPHGNVMNHALHILPHLRQL